MLTQEKIQRRSRCLWQSKEPPYKVVGKLTMDIASLLF